MATILTKADIDAELRKIADDLRAGKLKHFSIAEAAEVASDKPEKAEPEIFNMLQWHCGSICCIGGWLEHRVKKEFGDIRLIQRLLSYSALLGSDEKIYYLFHPDEIDGWDNITPTQAAAAIDNYLATGNPDWQRAVKETA